MKKLFLLLTAAIAFGVCAMAQDSRVATLQHGTNFRTYYGTDAFISAHADASDGDVITLTAGEFNCCDVTKALTIRGEGMNKTMLSAHNGCSFTIPQGSFSLCLEGLTGDFSTSDWYSRPGVSISSTSGSASVVIAESSFIVTYELRLRNINFVVTDSNVQCGSWGNNNSSIICINSIMPSLSGKTFDVQNCIIKGKVTITNSIIKNSIIYDVSTIDGTNTTSHCLVKYGSSGFANSWYVKTEPDVNPDPWGEDPETPVLWADLFGEDYHLTDAAAATYVGTDGTQVGIYGGAYPYDETPDYPLVKNLEVKGIHEDGKLQVKINVE